MLILLFSAALFLAFSNGANDNFKGFATIWGSASLGYRKALILATIATVAGGLASVVIAEGLAQQFSGKGLVGDDVAGAPHFALAVAGGAAITVMLATRLGFPISTTHALVGALVGAGMATDFSALDFDKLASNFVAPLLTSPILSAVMAFVAYLVIRRFRRAKVAPDHDLAVRINHEKPEETGEERTAGEKFLDGLHLLSANVICFARGVNDTPKLAALLIAANLFDAAVSAIAVTAVMALGGWLLSRRVAETMSLKINRLDPAQGISANIITSILVLGASRVGLPVSTTHVSVGSIIGTGAAAKTLDLSMVRNVLLSWVATLPIAGVLAFAIAYFAK